MSERKHSSVAFVAEELEHPSGASVTEEGSKKTWKRGKLAAFLCLFQIVFFTLFITLTKYAKEALPSPANRREHAEKEDAITHYYASKCDRCKNTSCAFFKA